MQCFYATGERRIAEHPGRCSSISAAGRRPRAIRNQTSRASGSTERWRDCSPNPAQKGSAYFAAPVTNQCTAILHANVDQGAAPPGPNLQIRYKQISGNTTAQEDDPPGSCGNNYQAGVRLTGGTARVNFDPQYARHAFMLEVKIRNVPNPTSIGLPAECGDSNFKNAVRLVLHVQRTLHRRRRTNHSVRLQQPATAVIHGRHRFVGFGQVDPVAVDDTPPCNGATFFASETSQAASVRAGGTRCFWVDVWSSRCDTR